MSAPQMRDRFGIEKDPRFKRLPEWYRLQFRVLTLVFPFRVTTYVLSMIDWSDPLHDPIFRHYFPFKEMLPKGTFRYLCGLFFGGASLAELEAASKRIRLKLNPHPAGQLTDNVPCLDGVPVPGVQHKYPETLLLFGQPWQQCNSYCMYCFRWAQFPIETEPRHKVFLDDDLRFSAQINGNWFEYIQAHPEITDILLTGGEPLFASAAVLRKFVEKLLTIPHVRTIRFGAKALAQWPQLLANGPDADARIELIRDIVRSGRDVAFMAHFSHPRELESPVLQRAVRRIQRAGAQIRAQAPMMCGVNDDADVQAKLWQMEVELGIFVYYTFISRDTGADNYWGVPLVTAWQIFRDAQARVSGLGRTARLSMSAHPGKIGIDGVAVINGVKVICLHMIQARDPSLVGIPFFAKYDRKAIWINGLEPAFADHWPWEVVAG